MKWLFPVIAGSVVLALGVTFSRSVHSRRAAVAAEHATANEAQVAAGRNPAIETADPDASSDAKSAADDPAKSVTPDDAAPAVAENAPADAPVQSAADAANPAVPDKVESPREVSYRILHLDAAELRNQLGAMLPKGFARISVDSRTNSLIVIGVERAHRKLQDLLKKLDRPAPETSDDSTRILIVPVQNRDAASLVELLKRMHGNDANVFEDPRTNSLIFPTGIDQKFLDIVRELDQPETKAKNNAPVAGAIIGNPLAELPIVGRMFASNQAPTGGPVSPAARDYQQYEAQCLALAAACREQLAAAPQDVKRIEQLKGELQGAVHSAFHARQSWQRGQAAQLRERLEQIERRISERSQISNEIIQHRVEELLNPEKQWEQDNSAAAAEPAAGPGSMKQGLLRTVPNGNKTPTAGAADKTDNSAADTGSTTARPDMAEQAYARSDVAEKKIWEALGIRLQKAIRSQLAEFTNRYRGGMEITEVRPQSVAAAAGIKPGDILVGLADYETVRWQDIQQILNYTRLFSGSDPAKFYVIRGNEVLHGTIKLAANGAPPGGSGSDRNLPAKLTNLDSNAAGRPLEGSTDNTSDLGRDVAQRALRQSLGDPRKELLNAEAAVATAEASIAEAKATYEASDLALKRGRALLEKGALSERAIRETEAAFERSKAALARAESELEIKRRMLQGAREMLALEIKLRESDLADAKARMDHAAAELARFEALYKQKAISLEVYEAKKLPQQLAASQYERAKLLLDLYQTALPDQKRFVDATQPAGVPDNPSNQGSALRPPRKVELDLFTNADDPRQRVLDAVHAIAAARAAVVAAEAGVAGPEQELKRMQTVEKGVIPQREFLRAEQSLASARTALQSKRVELDIKVQQLDEAREMLAGRIKLLEIDLADAKLRLEFAETDLSRATHLRKSAAISNEEYEAKRLAQRLAASQHERAQMLLDLYRKAIPGQTGNLPRTGTRPAAEEKPGAPQPGGGNPVSNDKPNEKASKPENSSDAKPQE